MNVSKTTPPQTTRAAGSARLIRLMGAPLAAVTEAEAVHAIVTAAAGEGRWAITANLDHLRRYHATPSERQLIDEADLVVADEMPLIWASRLAGEPLPERVSGSSMVWSICAAASARGQSVFLLGGNPGVAERAARVLRDSYPALEIAGTACPPLGFEDDARELDRLRHQIVEASPEIVMVALGFPKQDLLIRALRDAAPGASFLGVGISLSYVTGDLSSPPTWLCLLGLEWAYRLAQEPTRRLAQRYLIDGLPFGVRLMGSAMWRRLRGQGPTVVRGNEARAIDEAPPAREPAVRI
jgi:N-acetylglucosaminyldiphosphoundecaprenol N-acetyl-beta-D-mannosaminyltransferase